MFFLSSTFNISSKLFTTNGTANLPKVTRTVQRFMASAGKCLAAGRYD